MENEPGAPFRPAKRQFAPQASKEREWRPSLRPIPLPPTTTTATHATHKRHYASATASRVSGTAFRRGRRAFPPTVPTNPIVPPAGAVPVPPPRPSKAPVVSPRPASPRVRRRALRRVGTRNASSGFDAQPPPWGKGVEHTPGFWAQEGVAPLASYRTRIKALPRSARLILAARKSSARTADKAQPFTERVAIRRRDEAIQAVRALDAWSPTRVGGSAAAAAAAALVMPVLAGDDEDDTLKSSLSLSTVSTRSASRASDTSSEASFSEEIIARQAQERLSRRIKRAQARRKRRKLLVVIDANGEDVEEVVDASELHAETASAAHAASSTIAGRRASSEASRRLSIASTPVFQRLIRYG